MKTEMQQQVNISRQLKRRTHFICSGLKTRKGSNMGELTHYRIPRFPSNIFQLTFKGGTC
jgi:hypothetical protein